MCRIALSLMWRETTTDMLWLGASNAAPNRCWATITDDRMGLQRGVRTVSLVRVEELVALNVDVLPVDNES